MGHDVAEQVALEVVGSPVRGQRFGVAVDFVEVQPARLFGHPVRLVVQVAGLLTGASHQGRQGRFHRLCLTGSHLVGDQQIDRFGGGAHIAS